MQIPAIFSTCCLARTSDGSARTTDAGSRGRRGLLIEAILSETLILLIAILRPQSEVEDTLKRIQTHKGVFGVVVINKEGESFA